MDPYERLARILYRMDPYAAITPDDKRHQPLVIVNERDRETLSFLSGGRVTGVPAGPQTYRGEGVQDPNNMDAGSMFGARGGMTAAEITRIGQMSGTHEVRHTMRGRGWQPQERPTEADMPGYRYVGSSDARPPAWDEDSLGALNIEIDA
jgi:hypothetical protein